MKNMKNAEKPACKCRQLDSLVRELEKGRISKKDVVEFADSTELDLCSYRQDAKLAAFSHGLVYGMFGVGAAYAVFNIAEAFGFPVSANAVLASTIGSFIGFGLYHLLYDKKRCMQNNVFYEMIKKKAWSKNSAYTAQNKHF